MWSLDRRVSDGSRSTGIVEWLMVSEYWYRREEWLLAVTGGSTLYGFFRKNGFTE
jgi:hypothetical protein